MSLFQIRKREDGAILWTGCADDEDTALDAMAREAGYPDFASAPPEQFGQSEIEAAKLDLIS